MSKKTFTAHIGDFIAGKGFYIVLFLCVAAIGISGYYLFSSLGSNEEDIAAGTTAQVVVTPSPSPSLSVSAPVVKPTPTPSPTPTPMPSAAPAPTPTPDSSVTPTVAVFVWPVKGEILHDFSLEVLAYDETMGDWRTHSGIDIAASVGDQVLALSSGTVTQVYADDLMGTTVVIEHDDGLCSSYSNLATVPTVNVGDIVSAGDIIGSVGQTALAENTRASHLHLEVTQDGIKADPTQFLP